MRRILYVDPAPFPGGAQQSLITLVAALDRTEFEPFMAGSSLLQSLVPEGNWRALNIPTPGVPLGRIHPAAAILLQGLLSGWQLSRIMESIQPDIVHANGRGAWIPARLACARHGIPLVWHARDLVGPAWFDLIAANLSTLCITPSIALARQASLIPGKVRVIPNGVDTSRFVPGDRRSARTLLGLPQDRFIIGMVGQWVPWKRVDLFLEAARMAWQRDRSLYFVLVGAPPPGQGAGLFESYRAALDGLGVVMDWTPDVPGLLTALDALAHPAIGEAFGRIVVEAMSCGIPVLASRSGGMIETVEENITGMLLPPGESRALASSMLALRQDSTRAQRMGLAGRARAEKLYSAGIHAANVQEEYRRILARRGGGQP